MKTEKDLLIQKLIDDDVDTVINHDIHFLRLILECGIKGYRNHTLKELKAEVKERGLDESR